MEFITPLEISSFLYLMGNEPAPQLQLKQLNISKKQIMSVQCAVD
jgi:hypothetical protein